MSTERERMQAMLNKHDRALYGDGDKDVGLIRRIDPIERDLGRIMKLLMAILAAVLVALAMNVVQKFGSGNAQTVSQSISVDDPTVSRADAYTTEDLAKKMTLSVREIQDRAAKGEIPGARKDGKAWRFDRAAVDAALAASAAKAADAAKTN